MELREKEWDMAARVRERALADTREQVNLLLKELGNATTDIRARDTRISDLEIQLEEHRRQLVTVIARAASKNRVSAAPKTTTHARAKLKGCAPRSAKRSKVKRKPIDYRRKSHAKRR